MNATDLVDAAWMAPPAVQGTSVSDVLEKIGTDEHGQLDAIRPSGSLTTSSRFAHLFSAGVLGWLRDPNSRTNAIALVALNSASSIAIVAVNKSIFSGLGLHCVLLLSGVHCSISYFAFTRALSPADWEQSKQLSWRDFVLTVLCGLGSIVLSNVTLQLNSVSFYQISKTATVPLTALMEWAISGTAHSTAAITSLVFICVGVGIGAVEGTVEGSAAGVVCAFAAVACACLSAVIGKFMTRKYAMSSTVFLAAHLHGTSVHISRRMSRCTDVYAHVFAVFHPAHLHDNGVHWAACAE